MRTTRAVFLVLSIGVLAGCDCAGPTLAGDTGRPDGSPGMDGGGNDAFVRPDASHDAGPPRCEDDLDCPADLLCFGGLCQPDPCASASPCEGDDRCRAVCVALEDPCEGVVCDENETCVNGTCFPGCLPVACEGVSCPDGQFCDPSLGACRDISACDADCSDGAACHFTCTPRSACEGVTCEAGQFCRAGACIDNPCFGVVCEAGSVCQNGVCVETCGCDPACTPPERCIANRCVCIPHCAADAACGEPDGCGGFCDGACEGLQDECNPDTGVCECIPNCPTDAMCGRADGCGGLCMGPCADDRACMAGVCTCTDTCVTPAMVDCGTDVPDTCMGSRDCPGLGTRCDAGAECLLGECCGACSAASVVACGDPIPPVHDDDGDTCRTCSGVGAQCAASLTCVNPPGTSAATDRVCCGACPAASAVGCGMEIADVRDADGRVCRDCTGYGTAGCGSGTTCTGGATGTCCAACAASSAVDCGDPIPSPSCRTCTGYGARCDTGETCRNPPGTTSAADRVCCGTCAAAATVACGMPVPAVRADDGTVCLNCGTGSMCPSGQDCISGACCPRCPSGSSVACGVDIPDQRNGAGAVCRMCGEGTMCAGGTTCTGGTCCPGCAAASSLACGTNPTEPAGCAACPNGTMCPSGERCRDGSCCAPSCTAPSTRACGSTPSDGCGGTCAPGTMCTGTGETCSGSPLACRCTPSCVGRRCGEANGCGGECIGSCDPGFVCSERPPPAMAGDYQCEPSECVPSCGLCQSCVLGECEPLTCAPGETPCLFGCECCAAGEICMPSGCSTFG